MANTYYDSQLTAAEIEAALEAIDGVIVPANNGKVLAIENGTIVAKSVTEYIGAPVLINKTIIQDGTYNASDDGADGYISVEVDTGSDVSWNDALCVNWNFANPSNSNNQASYTASENSVVFAMDGWSVYRASVTLATGGVKIAGTSNNDGYLYQRFNSALTGKLNNKQVTLSAIVDGILVSKTFTINNTVGMQGLISVSDMPCWLYRVSATQLSLNFGGALSGKENKLIQAVKLELGDTQTLATQKNGVWVLNREPDKNYEYIKAYCCVVTS